MSSSKLMMRPVILSRPENVAFLLVTLVDGGSLPPHRPAAGSPASAARRPWAGAGPAAIPAADWHPAARWRHPVGAARLRRLQRQSRAAGPAERRWYPAVAPAAATAPDRAAARPARVAAGRLGNKRPRGNSGTCSSSSAGCGCCWPRGIEPGGRNGGSEKILPICARARRAQPRSSRRPPGPQIRSGQRFATSRGFKGANRATLPL